MVGCGINYETLCNVHPQSTKIDLVSAEFAVSHPVTIPPPLALPTYSAPPPVCVDNIDPLHTTAYLALHGQL